MNKLDHNLNKKISRLIKIMGFVAKKANDNDSSIYAEIYQMLGAAWEYYGLMCKHRGGFKKVSDGKLTCKICGWLKGASSNQFLLDNSKPKVIGRMISEPSYGKQPYPNQKLATIVKDRIKFHGAELKVNVHRSYKSKLLKRDISIATGREVSMKERGITFRHDGHLAGIELPRDGTHKNKEKIYGAFLYELPKKAMKYFPILLNYKHTRKGLKLIDIEVFLSRK